MRTYNPIPCILLAGILAGVSAASLAHTATVWDGPLIGFYHTQENNLQDQLTADVALTRGGTGGLYNSVLESGPDSGISPLGTQWAVGTLTDYTNGSLSFGPCPLEAGQAPPGDVGTTYVVYLTDDDIYFELTLTNWGGQSETGDRTFGYTRSTPAVVVVPTPTISITNPVSGAIFVAPANVRIGADAEVSSGTVGNVQFLTNGVPLGSVTTSPFIFSASNLGAGAYALQAVATAAGISATSSVVNITVVAVPTVSLTNPVAGAVLAAPADLKLGASAASSSGPVTNLQFFANATTLLKSVSTAPFTTIASNLAAGSYTLTAVATAKGISATSSPVNVSVVTPLTVNLSAAKITAGKIAFSYSANPGLAYVVQSSSNLVTWVTVGTNTAAVNPVPFSSPATNGSLFYRIGRLPNP